LRGRTLLLLLLPALAGSCLPPPLRLMPDALGQDAVIRRDRFGIPHILARTDEAAAFAFGYAQAEDHGLVIARRLISARGEEAKYFGESGIENDFAMARLDNLTESRRGLERVSPVFRRMLAAYAAGLNAHLRQRRSLSPAAIPEFDAADIMANLRAPAVAFAAGEAIVRGLRDKYESWPPDVATITDDPPGSNALALSGSRTVSRKPLLLGNPHLDWASLYWEAHVTVPGRMNFYGSTLVGLPVLRAGFNDRLAFVQTNNTPDLDDIYRLPVDPAAPDHYRFDNRQYPLTAREISIDVRLPGGSMERQTRTYWYSHLGPIVYRDDAAAFALRSMRLEAWQYFEGFHHAAQANSLDEFLDVMRRRYIPTSNFTYADADGNILYLWNARLPRRLDDGSSYELDLPGLHKYLWRGLHDFDDLPRLLNPRSGYVQNANSPPRFASLDDPIDMRRYPSYVERGALGLRPQLALRMVQERTLFAAEDIVRLKFDTRVLLAARVKPALMDALTGAARLTPEAQAGFEALEAWDDRASAGSRGAALFFRFWDTYSRATRQPFATPWNENQPIDTPAGLSDSAAAIRHLEDAVRWMRETHGTERAAWGEVNRYRIGDVDLPGEGCSGVYGCFRVQRFDAPTPGVSVAGNLHESGPVGFGDAWVLVVDFSTPVPTAWSLLAYGQTSDLSSVHSRDQIELLAARKLRPVFFTEADIRANLEREYRPGGE
jgi:acyl-homoserine-lactone acylase